MTDIFSLKSIDKFVGKPLCRLLPRCNYRNNDINDILVIRPGGIGDAVLLAPAINSLKSTYPHIRITVMAEKRNAGVFALIPGVNEVLCYDCPLEFVRALCGQYDAVVDTEQWYRLSAVVARLTRAPMKIGFDTNERRRMFTHGIPYELTAYETYNFMALLKPLGINTQLDCSMPSLALPRQTFEAVERLLQRCDDTFVSIFPGASIPEKQWGADCFRQLAALMSAIGIRSVVVGGKAEHRQGEAIVEGNAGLNLAGTTSLPETAAVIHKSSLLVSGDSGVLHIAASLGVPTVSLFGPSSTGKWAPQGDCHISISTGQNCSPCSMYGITPACPFDFRCMRDITVDEVFNAVCMLLTSTAAIQSRCCKRDWMATA